MPAKPSSHDGPCTHRWNRFVGAPTCTCRFASSLIAAGSIRAATGALTSFMAPSVSRGTYGSRLLRALEQRNALDVRRVREHVDRADPLQLVAVFVAECLHVRGERRRVARHVDDAWRADRPQPLQRLPGEAGARRVDDVDVGRARALEQLLDDLTDVAGEERRVR